jgi:hypothetical protein
MFTLKHMKPIHSFCGQNADLLIAKAAGTYSYHWSLINEFELTLHVNTYSEGETVHITLKVLNDDILHSTVMLLSTSSIIKL